MNGQISVALWVFCGLVISLFTNQNRDWDNLHRAVWVIRSIGVGGRGGACPSSESIKTCFLEAYKGNYPLSPLHPFVTWHRYDQRPSSRLVLHGEAFHAEWRCWFESDVVYNSVIPHYLAFYSPVSPVLLLSQVFWNQKPIALIGPIETFWGCVGGFKKEKKNVVLCKPSFHSFNAHTHYPFHFFFPVTLSFEECSCVLWKGILREQFTGVHCERKTKKKEKGHFGQVGFFLFSISLKLLWNRFWGRSWESYVFLWSWSQA